MPRRATILILNHSPSGLELDPESTQLRKGELKYGADSQVPGVIPPGGFIVIRCKSAGFPPGIEGAVTCRLEGHAPHDSVRFTWKSRYVLPNVYKAETSREGYTVEVEGGGGTRAVVLFVFSKYRMMTPSFAHPLTC